MVEMGVDIPAATVESVLQEQAAWEKKRKMRSTKEYHHKRYTLMRTVLAISNITFYQEPSEEGQEDTP